MLHAPHAAVDNWWRIYLQGHSKVLLRHREHAIPVAEILAKDEAQLRREQRQG
jgi:hypothetical protein